jgi:hypothetical protein
MSAIDAVDGSSAGTGVPRKWVLFVAVHESAVGT